MTLEEQAINPLPTETEDSADFDPMEMLGQVDKAYNEEQQRAAAAAQQTETTEEVPPADGQTPPAGTEETTPPADQPDAGTEEQPKSEDAPAPDGGEQPPTAERIKQLEAAAKEAIRYRKFFNSEKGQKLLDLMQKEEEAAAADAGKEKQPDQDPVAENNERFKAALADLLGIDKDHALFKILDQKMKDDVEAAIAPMRKLYEQAQLAQETAAGNEMAADFAEYLMEDLKMPEQLAKQTALRALHDIREKHSRYDQQTYYNEFLQFEKVHISPHYQKMTADTVRSLQDENKTLKEELELYKSGKMVVVPGKQDETNPPNTSTKEAAARIISGQDANYKGQGSIPGGSQIPSGTPDAGTQIADMIASLTSD